MDINISGKTTKEVSLFLHSVVERRKPFFTRNPVVRRYYWFPTIIFHETSNKENPN